MYYRHIISHVERSRPGEFADYFRLCPNSGKTVGSYPCQGTGTSSVLLITVVRPSKVSIRPEVSKGSARSCQRCSAFCHAASRAALTFQAAIVSSRRETGGNASPRRRTFKVCLADSTRPSSVELRAV